MMNIRELMPYILIAFTPLLGRTANQGTVDNGSVSTHSDTITMCGTGFDPPAAVRNRARVPALPAFTSAGVRSAHVIIPGTRAPR